ncbi:helix-turn-helix domain-containing protein [Gymnodinialimonas sp.]
MDSESYAASLRFELKKKSLTLADIAGQVGVSTSLVSKTLKKQRKNADVQHFVADTLGVPVEQLWHLEFRDALVSIDCERKEGDPRKAS